MKLQGDLREFSLADLLRILDDGQRTGRLVIETPVLSGALVWRSGRLVHAELGSLQGDEAIYPWLVWPEGRFVFEDGDFAGTTVQTGIPDLLGEGMQRQYAWSQIGDLAPGWGPDSRIVWLDSPDGELPLAATGASACDLVMTGGGMTVRLAQALAERLSLDRVKVEPTEAGAMHRWFQRLTAEIHASFAAISGFKLIAELDRFLTSAIEARGWELAWSGGRVIDKIPFARTADEQLALYDAFLDVLAGFILPVYGQALLRKATEHTAAPVGTLAQALRDRWLQRLGSGN